jgi:hypothetical protein
MKLVIGTFMVLTLGSAAAVLLLPASPQERMVRRQAEAQRLVDQLTQEVWNYYHDHGCFPPGDGIGSGTLVKALRRPSKAGAPYMLVVEEMITSGGDIRNPVAPERAIIFYRNNLECRDVELPLHNREAFDIWCRSADGLEDGVNNWD